MQSYARHELVLRAVVEAVAEAQATGGALEGAAAAGAAAAIVTEAMAAPLPLLAALRSPRVADLEATPYTGAVIRVFGRHAAAGILALALVLALFLLMSAILGI